MSDVKKKYYVENSGTEGRSIGFIFLTEAEAEIVNRVSDKENWDTIIDDDGGYECHKKRHHRCNFAKIVCSLIGN